MKPYLEFISGLIAIIFAYNFLKKDTVCSLVNYIFFSVADELGFCVHHRAKDNVWLGNLFQ